MSAIQCSNCHKMGHIYINCDEPQTSYGIICYSNINDDNKIILIRRKDTIGYMEFIRGKYEPEEDEYIIQLMDMMTKKEKQLISENMDFDKLRNLLGMTKETTINTTEYNNSHRKFNLLIYMEKLGRLLENSKITWDTPEWGLPKGRKNPRESPKSCAIREFYEETGLTDDDIMLYPNIKPLEEMYVGINGVKYKHIYYFAKYINHDHELKIDPNNRIQTIEVSDIIWSNLQEAQELIRPYHKEKLAIIKKSFQILKSKDKYFTEVDDCITVY